MAAGASGAAEPDLHATMQRATQDGRGAPVGTITVSVGTDGAVFKLNLEGLPVGAHGFHVYEMASAVQPY
jgi:Cu-Zn family superoxide dismutase